MVSEFPPALAKTLAELGFQLSEVAELSADGGELPFEKVLDMETGARLPSFEEQQLANLGQGKAQILRLANEAERIEMLGIKQPEASLGARRLLQQPLPLVETDGIDTHAGEFRRLPDLDGAGHLSSRIAFSRAGRICQTGPFQ